MVSVPLSPQANGPKNRFYIIVCEVIIIHVLTVSLIPAHPSPMHNLICSYQFLCLLERILNLEKKEYLKFKKLSELERGVSVSELERVIEPNRGD